MQSHTLRPVSDKRSEVIEDYNVIIVGGGPAGISAGIYAKYDGNNPLIIEEKTLAWIPEKHVNLLEKLEGFPALLNTVNGTQLVDRFRFSLSEMGVEYVEGVRVEKVTPGDDEITVETTNGTYETKAVVVATGTVPITLDDKLVNGHEKDVYYFAYNNFEDYIGQEVAVLGSRNSGSTAAIYLAKRGLKVTIFEIKETVQAKYKHTQHFEPLGIKTITSAQVKRLEGSQSLERLIYEKDGQDQTIDCRAVFCYIGVRPLLDIASDLKLPLNEQGYVDTNFYQTSPTPGIFVAGDMCGDLKHIIAACGQGAKAAYNVNKYFSAHK